MLPLPPPAIGWIAILRECRGLSLAELGRRLGVDRATAGRLEIRECNGNISLMELRQVAAVLDCDFGYTFRPTSELVQSCKSQWRIARRQ